MKLSNLSRAYIQEINQILTVLHFQPFTSMIFVALVYAYCTIVGSPQLIHNLRGIS
ncbi:hypothetical protein K450DRAFT_216664 [Umbelopsis ramanniana AG]|uniref:Uncharacterized protein n=1 Tax=Umbelopsis ramanniana AG TaxID=1314678 RepID=A0AAD5EJ44_UMBRA|nr:uncharacterized protein K450DRAFT_216664 [Umbelopsis ramanniana AG]KAI8584499.1 hypothetical protein K450DRAFT_216664 [Umbelopsis ramanniana AG]